MDEAEALMEEHPDSALTILNTVNKNFLGPESDKARYALLMSIALDKNYIDTTEFDVLQPAIDYYLSHGTPDERLKTYYCQSIVYVNRNHPDSAMKSLLKGLEMRNNIKDTLALANLISVRGVIQFSSYAFEDFTRSSLDAMELYHAIGHKDY